MQSRRQVNRFAFASGHFGKSLIINASDLLLAWHLRVEAHLSGSTTGTLLFLFLMISAFSTFVVGNILTTQRVSPRRLLLIQLAASMVTGAALVLQFTALSLVGALIAGLVFRIGYAIYDIPQNAFASLLPIDDAETHFYARLRTVLSAIARLGITVSFVLLGQYSLSVTHVSFFVIAVAAVASSFVMLWIRAPHREQHPSGASDLRTVPEGAGSLLLLVGIAFIILPTTTRLLIFAADEGWMRFGGWLLFMYCVGSGTGPVLLGWMHRVLGRNTTMFVVAVLATCSALAHSLVAMPVGARMIAALIHGISLGAFSAEVWAAVALLARIDAIRVGERRDAMIFGAAIAVIHGANAIGFLIIGPLIEGTQRHELASGLLAALITSVAAALLAWLLCELSTQRVASAA